MMVAYFDWSYAPDRRGLQLCSACAPPTYRDGKPSRKGGAWHGEFERVFLPPEQFKTNGAGNLEHIETGSEDFVEFEIDAPLCMRGRDAP